MKEKVYLQITSGRGPAECCRVVALVLERIVRQAQAKGLKVEMIERETGPVNRTLLSATTLFKAQLAVNWLMNGKERCNGLPKARTAFIISVRIGLSAYIPLSCPKVRRQRNMISVMKPCGLPVRAGNTSIKLSLLSVQCISRQG